MAKKRRNNLTQQRGRVRNTGREAGPKALTVRVVITVPERVHMVSERWHLLSGQALRFSLPELRGIVFLLLTILEKPKRSHYCDTLRPSLEWPQALCSPR